jgi:hypothetical protein
LVLVLLTVFVMGVAVGVIGMVPRWWKHRQLARANPTPVTPSSASATSSVDPSHGI